GHTAFAYALDGAGTFDPDAREVVDGGHLVLFRDGEGVRLTTRDKSLRMLLISGRPIGEPVAWWGPIVMTNRKDLEQAVEEYQNGTFLKRGSRPPA
ncbi:MAG: pirin family protein, partial [Thermoplasmata archaeon]|nr:pirin family protein [Thermoplasmata archaeon]